MKDVSIDTRSQRMLELLAQGAGSKLIAKELGYQDGTMRVYLHNLYRKLGVANKTEAVIWYLKNGEPDRPTAGFAVAQVPFLDDPVGQMALADGLYATLGVMGQFLGPWSRVWEVGAKLSGDDLDVPPEGIRARSLWSALLKGDFAAGKADYEADEGSAFLGQDSKPVSGAVFLAAMLVAGGYSHAARQFISRLKDKRRSGPTLPAREASLLDAALEAFEGKDGLGRLQKLAEGTSPAPFRQLAMAMLFHAALLRRDTVLARQVASMLWKEAEAARKELQAVGDTALAPARTATPPPSKKERATGR
jgi:DNA-binding CsgD family transcriptional regulator